jgi:hypothetical protein
MMQRGFGGTVDSVRGRFSRNQLHHQEVTGVDFLDAVYCSAIGMIQRREHPRFTLESHNTLDILTGFSAITCGPT